MGHPYSKYEIFQLQSDAIQFKEWNANEGDADFVSHSKKAVIIAFNEELTEKQKLYYTMYHLQGISIPKIASMLGVNRSTVSRTITRARRKLARVLRYSAPHLMNQKPEKRNRRVRDGK